MVCFEINIRDIRPFDTQSTASIVWAVVCIRDDHGCVFTHPVVSKSNFQCTVSCGQEFERDIPCLVEDLPVIDGEL